MACRNIENTNKAKLDIEKTSKTEKTGKLIVKQIDLNSFKSIRAFADQVTNEEPHINLLINNAGVFMCPKGTTEDGFEIHLASNYLGHYLLTMLLIPKLKSSAPSRIVNVASNWHCYAELDLDDLNWEKKEYKPFKAYCNTKLMNILFTSELSLRLTNTRVNVYAAHPGYVQTNIHRHFNFAIAPLSRIFWTWFGQLFVKTSKQGAQTVIYCAVDENLEGESGLYYTECKEVTPSSIARDHAVSERLWDISWKLAGIESYGPFVQETMCETTDVEAEITHC